MNADSQNVILYVTLAYRSKTHDFTNCFKVTSQQKEHFFFFCCEAVWQELYSSQIFLGIKTIKRFSIKTKMIGYNLIKIINVLFIYIYLLRFGQVSEQFYREYFNDNKIIILFYFRQLGCRIKLHKLMYKFGGLTLIICNFQ